MDYRILGPLEVAEQNREIVVGRGRQRSLLVVLLLHANEVVSSDRLIDELWGDAPPPTAAKTVQVYVSQLRKVLRDGDGHGPLLTRGHGYVLRVAPGELDLERFERALADGRRALERDAPDRAAAHLRDALALWRGPPLADFAYEVFAQSEIARLEELRLAAMEERIEADLALGRHAEVVGDLDALVADHPLRERLRGQLMLALYRCDRQADALAVYREGRKLLSEELGLEPSPTLRRLEASILAHEPGLTAPPRRGLRRRNDVSPVAVTPSRRARALLVGGAVMLTGAIAGAALLPWAADPPAQSSEPVTFSALAALAPSGQALAAVPLPGASRLAVGGRLVWVGDEDSRSLLAIDARTRRLLRTVPTGLFPTDVAADAASVWVLDDARRRLARIDARYGRVRERLKLKRRSTVRADRFEHDPASVAVGAGAVWITDGTSRVVRVDRRTTRESGWVDTGRRINGVAAGARAVWVISGARAQVLRLDPRTLTVTARLEVVDAPGLTSPFPVSVAVGGDYVWVLSGNTATVTQIDARQRAVVRSVPVDIDRAPAQIAADERSAWIANGDGTVTRIEAETDRVDTFEVGNTLRDVAVGAGAVWVSNRLADCCDPGSGSHVAAPSPGERPPAALAACSRVHYGGPSRPDVLIASDLPLHGTYGNDGVQGSHAVRLILEERGFRAGPHTVGYVSCDAATSQDALTAPQVRTQRTDVWGDARRGRAHRAFLLGLRGSSACDPQSSPRAAGGRRPGRHLRRPHTRRRRDPRVRAGAVPPDRPAQLRPACRSG